MPSCSRSPRASLALALDGDLALPRDAVGVEHDFVHQRAQVDWFGPRGLRAVFDARQRQQRLHEVLEPAALTGADLQRPSIFLVRPRPAQGPLTFSKDGRHRGPQFVARVCRQLALAHDSLLQTIERRVQALGDADELCVHRREIDARRLPGARFRAVRSICSIERAISRRSQTASGAASSTARKLATSTSVWAGAPHSSEHRRIELVRAAEVVAAVGVTLDRGGRVSSCMPTSRICSTRPTTRALRAS